MKRQILYFDGYDEVCQAVTGETIFSTIGIPEMAVDGLVNIWNENDGENCLGSGGVLDDYLLNDAGTTTEQDEVIREGLYRYFLGDLF